VNPPMLALGKILFALASSRSDRFEMSTTALPRRPTKKAPAESKLTIGQLIAKMDKALPKWKPYVANRKAKVTREKRRGLREFAEFERLYTELRRSGLKLADARKHVKAS
jgi:hypothetical protein